jgi:hypothetical protein
MRHRDHVLVLGLAISALVQVADTPTASACGCLSPPAVTEGDYAVNQSAEQIIFEVEPGWVTAHVLIKYAGDPAQFGWLIPVPEVPELAISPVSAFGLLDQLTAPDVAVSVENICPTSAWACQHYQPLICDRGDDFGGVSLSDAGGASADAGAVPPPVTVINEQVVGDYQTVTFRATEAAAATQWLHDNGFIVNPTTSIYMESYVQANMVFVAAKLVPGAGVKAIKPLRMHYRAAYPMIPLILTAVAAEPHLTVTAFVYADQPFRPMGHPVVTIAANRIAQDAAGRLNYPMVLARTIDEAGGDGFAIEYRGSPVQSTVGQSGCCGGGYDYCYLGDNQQCECPRDEFDHADCSAIGDLVEGITLLDDLTTRYSSLTRITTRVSPEEMKFDPQFEPDFDASAFGRLTLRNTQASLAACRSSVIDKPAFQDLDAVQACASMYCGEGGTCVTTAAGPACSCAAGRVATRFNDLDSQPSVTCIPTVAPVDLRAGGQALPDACAGVSCGAGTCMDRNGVAVCACNAGAAAVAGGGATPRCEPIELTSETPGAQDYSAPLRTVQVCAPPPPTCGEGSWLEKVGTAHPGVDCTGDLDPPAHLTIPGPKPTCGSFFGCGGCQEGSEIPPLASVGAAWIVLALVIRRRRARRT